MIELISLVCSVMICILTPLEVNRLRAGWAPKKFEADRETYLVRYRAQLRMLTYVGLGFGALTLVLVLIESEPGEKVFKAVAGLVWFAVAFICHTQRARLPEASQA
jgi:hypothetical protein